jgi:hypothetical protein
MLSRLYSSTASRTFMNNRIAYFALLLALCFASNLRAQQVIMKLEIKEREVYLVGPDNVLLVDSLIMHNKASIQFNHELPAYVGVNAAYIGNNCKLIMKGRDASYKRTGIFGANGQDGAATEINIHLKTLGSLTVDARGGNGDKGEDGKSETPATKKTDGDGSYKSIAPASPGRSGSAGGNGGNGGNITLTYSTDGFIPRFNQHRNINSIMLLTQGGKGGKPGMFGKLEGQTGADGQVKLINQNMPVGRVE